MPANVELIKVKHMYVALEAPAFQAWFELFKTTLVKALSQLTLFEIDLLIGPYQNVQPHSNCHLYSAYDFNYRLYIQVGKNPSFTKMRNIIYKTVNDFVDYQRKYNHLSLTHDEKRILVDTICNNLYDESHTAFALKYSGS